MNFISIAVSVFITNVIIIQIIRWLPLRKKIPWQIGVVSLSNAFSIIGYLYNLLKVEFDILYLLEKLGSILGVIIAYVAAMMIILDGITIFKSKRLRQFERDLNKGNSKSVPRHVLAIICLAIFAILVVYSVVSIINYKQTLLFSLIGTSVAALISLSLAIYFFISGNPLHKSITAENLLFIIKLQNKTMIYSKQLSKDFTINDALGGLNEIFIIDEYGLIVTPSDKYIAKGIKVDSISADYLNKINMDLYNDNNFDEVIKEFNKYTRKKIVLDENNNITKIINIK